MLFLSLVVIQTGMVRELWLSSESYRFCQYFYIG